MIDEENLIKVGDYLVIQRVSFMKLHKLKANGTVTIGKGQVELENVIGKPYCSTFRMVVKPRNKNVYTLERVDEYINSIQDICIDKSGIDNRNINDDGQSQLLTTEDILKLREEEVSSSGIVEKLITNSKTFNDKTEYSQTKYLRKKERKYFEYIQILKPTVRLIAEIYYRQEPGKVLGLRIDDLSQILSYANVQDNSKILLYDSGTSGLLMSAVMHRIGKSTTGTLVYMYPGNLCQKEAYLALKFSEEQNERCITVCLYSVLRCFYQNYPDPNSDSEIKTDNIGTVKKAEDSPMEDGTSENRGQKRKCSDESELPAKKLCWQVDNERACAVLSRKVDALIVVAKEHPSTIVDELLAFLNDGGSVVIFSLLRECLESVYFELKNRADIISLRLVNSMVRNYQVLPDRTHPDVQMTSGGYILTGFKIAV